MIKEVERILISEQELQDRVKEMGRQITEDYKGKNLLIVSILKGAVIFASDLVMEIKLPLTMDFMAVSSYGASTKSSGVVRILKDLDQQVADKDILIIEDIVDTGLTLHYLIENLQSRKPRSIKVCCCLDKPSRRKADVQVDYIGFEVPDEFVVGYGLDYAQKFRNLPYIGILSKEAYS